MSWLFDYYSSHSDGSPYEKRIDKKGNVLSDECIVDEVPFEIPDSWEWVRMESVLTFVNGRAYKKQELLESGKYPVLRVGNLFTNSSWYYSDLELDSSKYCHNGDLLYAWSASFGPTIWTGPDCIFHYHIWNVKHSKLLDRSYLYWVLFQDVIRIRQATTGSTMIHVSMENMKPRFLPVPPLAEQRRIVERVNELIPLVDEYGKLEDVREKLNTELPDCLRKSVLQMAVQGKLVPQDPADEPAAVLLMRIREKRAELIRQKKMKAPKGGESLIFTASDGRHYEKKIDAKGHESEPICIEDEIPFEIPDSWEWARLESIAQTNGGYAFKSDKYQETGIRVVRISDFNESGFIDKEIVRYQYDDSLASFLLEKSDILMCMTGGTVGKTLFVDSLKEPMLVNQRVATIKKPFDFDPDYLYCVISNGHIRKIIAESKNSTNDNISLSTICRFLIPIPPLAEQHRIVERVNDLKLLITNQ